MATIILCSMILLSGGAKGLLTLSSQGYTTGYQGAHATFYGIDYQTSTKGSEIIEGKHTFALKSTMMHFDADEKDHPRHFACNLEGEMTAVFLPEGARPSGWVDPEWWDIATGYITNPVNTYEWELHDETTNTTHLYAMEEWRLKWYVSISADWDDPTSIYWGQREYYNKRYMDTQVWFEFDLTPIWYFEGTNTAYFCIAEIRVSDITLGGKEGGDRKPSEANPNLRVNPMSKGSILPIFYGPFGSVRADKTAYQFQGKALNPNLFTDKVYSYYTLVNFGTRAWDEALGFQKSWRGDVVTLGFDVHVFVVGEWKVKDIQEIPDEYGRTAQTGTTGGPFDFLERIISLPEFRIWGLLGALALFFLILAIFAPSVLFAIFAIFGFRGKKKR